MDNKISFNEPVYELTNRHPELIDLLVELGFTQLADEKVRKSIGRVVTLNRGSELMNIPTEKIKKSLIMNGYTVVGDD